MGIELEQKYVVDSQRPWQVQAELLSLLNRAGYEVRLLGETPQEDVYYDTPEDDFLLTGGSLRVRGRGAAGPHAQNACGANSADWRLCPA